MTGTQMLQMLSQILGGESINQTFALQLINISRAQFEMKRAWRVLVALDNSLSVTPSNTFQTPFNVPTTFMRYLNEGAIQLWDGVNDLEVIFEVPYEMTLAYYQNFGRFSVDNANRKFYLMGLIPKNYTIYQYFIQDPGDITLSTTWKNFPARFQSILVFDAATRWRLGTDYDDVNARNADDNAKMVDLMYAAMSDWDTELQLAAVNSLDYGGGSYPGISGRRNGPGNAQGRLGPGSPGF